MKFFITFILCLLLMSALPILWNQFSFVEAGFPFIYLFKKTFDAADGNALIIAWRPLNLLYDVLIAAILAWAIKFSISKYSQTKS
ncbi:hypothetical protein [Pedobacter ginsengisoli]|uniref:hypothetical protein n=1 Tax=Pedobacter ginsengisoli TaxID=363852 RepID=UPI00254EFEF6|nr:hypothetical protein [Pedobacter ginsengisoli]